MIEILFNLILKKINHLDIKPENFLLINEINFDKKND